jgi:hypothetical protein
MLGLIAWMLVLHFIADFILQPRTMGKKKSENIYWLIGHLLIQFFVMALGLVHVVGHTKGADIALANAFVHGLIDWYIWKGYKLVALWKIKKEAAKTVDYRLANDTRFKDEVRENMIADEVKFQAPHWKYWEDHWFFVTIGLDQLLHALTLIALAAIFKP